MRAITDEQRSLLAQLHGKLRMPSPEIVKVVRLPAQLQPPKADCVNPDVQFRGSVQLSTGVGRIRTVVDRRNTVVQRWRVPSRAVPHRIGGERRHEMRLTKKQQEKRLGKDFVAWVDAYIGSLREGLEQHEARVDLEKKARKQKPARNSRKR